METNVYTLPLSPNIRGGFLYIWLNKATYDMTKEIQ